MNNSAASSGVSSLQKKDEIGAASGGEFNPREIKTDIFGLNAFPFD
jgi:hypothetical protein